MGVVVEIEEQERLEEKRAEKRAEDKERMEILLTKGSSVEELSANLQSGTAIAVNNILENASGNRLDISI